MRRFWKRPRGVSALVLTVTLMLLSTLFILFATQFSILQQRITANRYRNQQAFEAAQAGLEAAIPYFKANYSAIVAGASGGYLTPYQNSSTQNVALANSSRYSFVFSNPVSNQFQLITITATGVNADSTSTRVLQQQIQAYSASMPVPTTSLSLQGSVNLTNTASITNNQLNMNIDSGGSVSFAGSAHTTTNAGTTSSSAGLGNDILAHDNALSSLTSSTYFQATFGVSASSLKSVATSTYSNASSSTYNSNLNGITGAIIWIDQLGGTATINGTTAIGSVAQPVILVVNGDLLISGSTVINGFVFVLNPTTSVIIRRNSIINGAIASTGTLSFQGASALNYNATILNALPAVSSTLNYAKVPGSWRDF